MDDDDDLTHYIRWDMPRRKTAKTLRAVCGLEVPRERWSAEPTCPECKEWQADYDRLVLQ